MLHFNINIAIRKKKNIVTSERMLFSWSMSLPLPFTHLYLMHLHASKLVVSDRSVVSYKTSFGFQLTKQLQLDELTVKFDDYICKIKFTFYLNLEREFMLTI